MAYLFEQFFATRRIMAMQPAPDGNSVLFASDISGQINLWQVATEGGWPRQLTLFTDQAVRFAVFSKDGSHIAFVADHHGDEQYQVFLLKRDGGWPRQLTNRPDVQHQPLGFSPCGRYLAYSANADQPQHIDIYLYDLETETTRRLTPGGHVDYFFSFSPDGSKILAMRFYSNTDRDLILYDVATGQGQNLAEHSGQQIKFIPGPWLKDSSGFFFISNEGREFDAIGYYDLAAGKRTFFITAAWDIEDLALSGDGRLLAYVVNEAGNSVLHVVDRDSGEALRLPELPKGVISSLKFASQDAKRRLFVELASYKAATNIFVIDLDAVTLHQITESMLGNLPDEAFVAPELVYIDAHDGLKIPAWLYRPQGVQGKVPMVVSIHGGPEAQERPQYNYGGFYQYLLSRGVGVLAPNIRGSTGFGIDYQLRIHRDWGGAELKDIEACNHYLRSLDWVDAEKIGVWGGSFGGFATLSAASRLPDLWACACDFCGPSNLVSFTQSVPPHWRPMMKAWVGDPEEDREMLIERSPITYVDQITAPLMVVQGATDPRVVKAESDQMVERLRSLGREVEYLVFEDEGHGFTKKSNQLKGYGQMADFLIRHLVG